MRSLDDIGLMKLLGWVTEEKYQSDLVAQASLTIPG